MTKKQKMQCKECGATLDELLGKNCFQSVTKEDCIQYLKENFNPNKKGKRNEK